MATFAQRKNAGLDGRDIDEGTLQDHAQRWVLDVLGPEHPFAATAFAGSDGTPAAFSAALNDGQVLCHLINRLHELINRSEARHLTSGVKLARAVADPGSATEGTIRIKKIHSSKKPFKRMENITSFLLACRAYRVPDQELFTTADLFHGRHTRNIVAALHALSRRVQLNESWKGPIMGEKWTEVEEEAEDVPEPVTTGGPDYYYNKADWEVLYTDDDPPVPYYHNKKTGETTWDAPPGFEQGESKAGPEEEDIEEEEEDNAVRSGGEKIKKFNIGHIKVHDSVIADFAILKARRGRSWMKLCIEEEELVVFCEDSGDAYENDADLTKALLRSWPTGQCRYIVVDLSDRLVLLSWIPKIAQNHLQMMYASQIGTLQHAGGDKFTSFRGLQEVKTQSEGQVRVALLGKDAALAKKAQRRVIGRSAAAAAAPKRTPVKSTRRGPEIMGSARKQDDDSESDEEWDPDA